MSSSGTSPTDLLDRASGRDLGAIAREGVGGFMLAVATALISGVLTLADFVIIPLQATAAALGDIAAAILGGPPRVVLAGVEATVRSLLGPWAIGPFTLPLAVGVVLLTFWIVNAYRAEESTANVLLGSGVDIPTPWGEDPEEEKGD